MLCITKLPVLLVFNDTFNNVSGIAYNMVTNQFYWCLMTLSTMCTMLYVIPDTLLKVSLNTNKTGHHVIRYT
jgi:hypothetical protein